MNFLKKIIFLNFFFSSGLTYSETHMLVMGGSGDPQCIAGSTIPKNMKPECEGTIFDTSMKVLGPNLKQTKIKYQASFDGGHPKTEAIFRENFSSGVEATTPFTESSYKKMISDYKAKILMGEITNKDQLILMIYTHGAKKEGNEKTHKITTGKGEAKDLNNLAGAEVVSLDSLEELVQLTNERGIQLGIIDLSCHSGETLNLKKNAPNTCIITATGPKHYAYAGSSPFGTQIMKNVKPGTTLESAFLNARANSSGGAEYPMISTDEGAAIVAETYKAISPYLYYSSPDADKLTDYLNNSSDFANVCTQEAQFQKIIDQITSLHNASIGSSDEFNGNELKRLLVDYHKLQSSLKKIVAETENLKLDAKESFKAPFIMGGKQLTQRMIDYPRSVILSTDFDEQISRTREKLKNEKTAYNIADLQATIGMLEKAKIRQSELKRQYGTATGLAAAQEKINQQLKMTKDLSEKIALQEKKFYDEAYRKKQSLNFNDPCRKITF